MLRSVSNAPVRELIDEPARQAHDFINFLRAQYGTVTLRSTDGGVNEFDADRIRYFIPLTVTLENLGSVSNLRDLVDSSISQRNLQDLSSVVSLTDLMVIFEILDLQSERVHYLARRRDFDVHVRYHGDELDLLAFYLERGFNIGELEYQENRGMMLSLYSKELDPYFVARYSGMSISKPSLALTTLWKAMLTRLDKAKNRDWLEASLILLNVPYGDQQRT